MATKTDRHVAYAEERYLYTDDDGEHVYSPPRTVYCGDWKPGVGAEYCDECRKVLEKQYPQGWAYYAGDVCPHGKYVGGCGADLMCQRCEDGE